jgi:glycine/D-amino acid oxidase-like deaminating enzyme
LSAEVAVVGAGFTGLSTALHLAYEGIPTVLLEAGVPGAGASGRNAGWMQPDWWMKEPKQVIAAFGAELAERLTHWVAGGPRLLESWIERFAMSIEFRRSGFVLATNQARKAQALAAIAPAWSRLGLALEYLDAAEVRKHVATDRYCGGILLRDGATVNPLALSRELARVCVEQGVQLFANTPVIAIRRAGARWQLITPSGEASARRLVLATDAYTRALYPALTRALVHWRLAIVASEPYPALRDLLLTGRPFADLAMGNMFTLRGSAGAGSGTPGFQADHLVTSTFAPVRRGLTPAQVAEPFMRKFRRVFSAFPPPNWRYLHYGEVGVSRSMLLRLCSIGEQAWTAYGYSGHGVNNSLLMGGELARLAAGAAARESIFPVTQLEPLPLRRAVEVVLKYVHAPMARAVVSRMS